LQIEKEKRLSDFPLHKKERGRKNEAVKHPGDEDEID
jgi:hypothetical protein